MPHEMHAIPMTSGKTRTTDVLARHELSKERAMHNAPIVSSSAPTPQPSKGVTYEPIGRTISATMSATTNAPAMPKTHRKRRSSRRGRPCDNAASGSSAPDEWAPDRPEPGALAPGASWSSPAWRRMSILSPARVTTPTPITQFTADQQARLSGCSAGVRPLSEASRAGTTAPSDAHRTGRLGAACSHPTSVSRPMCATSRSSDFPRASSPSTRPPSAQGERPTTSRRDTT